jgi:hypothetical protein
MPFNKKTLPTTSVNKHIQPDKQLYLPNSLVNNKSFLKNIFFHEANKINLAFKKEGKISLDKN